MSFLILKQGQNWVRKHNRNVYFELHFELFVQFCLEKGAKVRQKLKILEFIVIYKKHVLTLLITHPQYFLTLTNS